VSHALFPAYGRDGAGEGLGGAGKRARQWLALTSMQMRPCLSSASRSHFRLGLFEGRDSCVGRSPSSAKPIGSHALPELKGISVEAPTIESSAAMLTAWRAGARIGAAPE